jgi:hypothetical protein
MQCQRLISGRRQGGIDVLMRGSRSPAAQERNDTLDR